MPSRSGDRSLYLSGGYRGIKSPFRTCFVPNNVLITNGMACLIHSVRVVALWPPNVADSVTFHC